MSAIEEQGCLFSELLHSEVVRLPDSVTSVDFGVEYRELALPITSSIHILSLDACNRHASVRCLHRLLKIFIVLIEFLSNHPFKEAPARIPSCIRELEPLLESPLREQ